MSINEQKHIVAIIGGAVSGAEAAFQLTQQGIPVVVFDQNKLPYGKIEDGLPKWHVKLRDKEEQKINERLSHPLVTFVPHVRLGKEIRLNDLVKDWGFSAVLLATGAWRDRPLPIPDIDKYINRGLVYQNPFIYWYNHKHEPGYHGPHYPVEDGAIIIGGGLASLDVAKVLMFETVERALRERGHNIDVFQLDRSIAKVLEDLDYTLEDLGLTGCTLYYRRRIKDMPLSPKPAETPDEVKKVNIIQEKIFRNYQRKYLFRVEPCHMPVDKIVEGGHLTGMVFQKTHIIGNKVVPQAGTRKEVRAPLIISSIGSIPEQIDGVPMNGQVYRICQEDCCRIEGYDNVFALGNAVTGRGNIRDSAIHGREVAQHMLESYLSEDTKYEESFRETEEKVNSAIGNIAARLDQLPAPTLEQAHTLMTRIRRLQVSVGYDNDFMGWVKKNLPVRLEEMENRKM